jgi:hypothetical protein
VNPRTEFFAYSGRSYAGDVIEALDDQLDDAKRWVAQ